jgi:SAF domain
MSPVASAAAAARRILVRRPWIYWSFVAVATIGTAASMLQRTDHIDAAREAWGTSRTVWVAVGPHVPGDALTAETREVPAAIVPDGALTDADRPIGAIARQRIGAGEIIHLVDVAANDRPQAITPVGWLAVPVIESPPSAARLGDRVVVASDGLVISADAVVVGANDEVTLIAVPAADAPGVAAADDAGALTLLLRP